MPGFRSLLGGAYRKRISKGGSSRRASSGGPLRPGGPLNRSGRNTIKNAVNVGRATEAATRSGTKRRRRRRGISGRGFR